VNERKKLLDLSVFFGSSSLVSQTLIVKSPKMDDS